ncbi:MAG: 3-phosphoshikimate 1-carboxyvinyltransferase [Nitrospiraceae bacterium]|nr:MAG: 3-phosphoshikimate 1-carboxyvinyltransferase [Nitrospiraceae bacterium]
MKRISITNRGPLRGELICPPDKSISHRAIILSSLAEGTSIVRNFLRAEDPLCTLEAFRLMGIEIEVKSQKSEVRGQNNEIVVNGKGLKGLRKPGKVIDCGNSGTTMRILSGVLAGQPFASVLTGDSSLRSRPMQRVITPLSQMGARIESEKGGYPPLRITGAALRPIRYESPVASAQVKSAVLLAGLYCSGRTTVIEPGKSRDHTERMLAAVGADITVKGLEVSVQGGRGLRPMDMTVPGDLSSAAFFIVAGLIVPGSELVIRNVGTNPTRSGLLDILVRMGAEIALENERDVSGEPVADIRVRHSSLTGIDVAEDLVLRAIDEFPILCVAAAKASGTTRITGAGELRVKESDRISSMAQELRKMAVPVEELEHGLVIEGQQDLTPAVISSYGDHRVAMSMAVAGLTEPGETIIEDTDCVNTSFPGFMKMVENLSAEK